jgi:hypothetical protein
VSAGAGRLTPGRRGRHTVSSIHTHVNITSYNVGSSSTTSKSRTKPSGSITLTSKSCQRRSARRRPAISQTVIRTTRSRLFAIRPPVRLSQTRPKSFSTWRRNIPRGLLSPLEARSKSKSRSQTRSTGLSPLYAPYPHPSPVLPAHANS